jgi:hypothetical protein
MPEDSVVKQAYLVPSHLKTQQSVGPFPARFLLPLVYSGVFAGLPLAVPTWDATNGLLTSQPSATQRS